MQEKNVLGIQIFESNYNIYIKYSNQLFNLLLEYTDVIERFSIDECFLDLTNFLSNNDILENKAIEIKERVKKELGFTVNVGVSTNKLLAKMASDFKNQIEYILYSKMKLKKRCGICQYQIYLWLEEKCFQNCKELVYIQ